MKPQLPAPLRLAKNRRIHYVTREPKIVEDTEKISLTGVEQGIFEAVRAYVSSPRVCPYENRSKGADGYKHYQIGGGMVSLNEGTRSVTGVGLSAGNRNH